jgi:pimeloyl-ACP methyl ester carboxylesterase
MSHQSHQPRECPPGQSSNRPSLLGYHWAHPLRLGTEIAVDLGLAAALVAGGAMLRLGRPTLSRGHRDTSASSPLADIGAWQPPDPARRSRRTPLVVTADDGVELDVRVDGAARAPVTVVLCHGYALNQESWDFQCAALRRKARVVTWDHRGHGRSGQGPSEHTNLDQLGRDLFAVLRKAAPAGPIVLVGHSMGGMAILALAGQHPELFGDRVVGVGLLATSAGPFSGDLGLPTYAAKAVQWAAPGVLSVLREQRPLTRLAARDLARLLTRRYAFASDVPELLLDFLGEMIQSTPIETLADLFPEFQTYDSSAALPVLRRVKTLLMVGDSDLLTPVQDSQAIADQVPEAEFVVAEDAGHAVILERPDLVTEHLLALLAQANQDEAV